MIASALAKLPWNSLLLIAAMGLLVPLAIAKIRRRRSASIALPLTLGALINLAASVVLVFQGMFPGPNPDGYYDTIYVSGFNGLLFVVGSVAAAGAIIWMPPLLFAGYLLGKARKWN